MMTIYLRLLILVVVWTSQVQTSAGLQDSNIRRSQLTEVRCALNSLSRQLAEQQLQIAEQKMQLAEQQMQLAEQQIQLKNVTGLLESEIQQRQELEKTVSHLIANQSNNCSQDGSTTPPPSDRWLYGGKLVNQPYNEVLDTVINKNNTQVLYKVNYADKMSVINSQLWVPIYSNNTIQVLSTDEIHRFREIVLDIYSPYSVMQANNNEAILASDVGLYVLDLQGNIKYKVGSGVISDLDIVNEVCVCFNYSNNNIVVVKLSNSKWQVDTTFLNTQSTSSYHHTIQLNNDIIYLGSPRTRNIYTFTISGQYVNTIGSSGSTLPGRFLIPQLCGKDNLGGVLVCDRNVNRLQVFTANGEWKVFNLQIRPLDVVVDRSGNLWILDATYTIVKYSV